MCEALKYFNILKYKLGKKILKWKIGGKNYDQGGLSFCVLFFIIFYTFIKKTHSPPSRGGSVILRNIHSCISVNTAKSFDLIHSFYSFS